MHHNRINRNENAIMGTQNGPVLPFNRVWTPEEATSELSQIILQRIGELSNYDNHELYYARILFRRRFLPIWVIEILVPSNFDPENFVKIGMKTGLAITYVTGTYMDKYIIMTIQFKTGEKTTLGAIINAINSSRNLVFSDRFLFSFNNVRVISEFTPSINRCVVIDTVSSVIFPINLYYYFIYVNI